MDGHEDILIPRVEKFLLNMRAKHKTLSATNSVGKILDNLKVYEVGLETIDRIYDLIDWSESHDNIKEVEAEFKELADNFWE